MKNDDLVDVMDTSHYWYTSMVMGVRNHAEANIKELKIAFRYPNENGDKTDEETKQKFQGWSNKFDEWIPAHNVRIQKPFSIAK